MLWHRLLKNSTPTHWSLILLLVRIVHTIPSLIQYIFSFLFPSFHGKAHRFQGFLEKLYTKLHLAHTRIYFIGIRAFTIKNERITLETVDKEWLDMPLNCRESLVLSTASVYLQLERPRKVADDDSDDGGDHDVHGVAVVKFEAFKFTWGTDFKWVINIVYVFCFKLDTDNDTVEKRLLFFFFFYFFIFPFVYGNTWSKLQPLWNYQCITLPVTSNQLKAINSTDS